MVLPAPPSTRLATLFGIGNMPFAPGTLAALAALPIGWWLAVLGGWFTVLAASILLTLLGIWAGGRYAKAMGVDDPSECVIDEAAGQWLALVPLAFWERPFLFKALALALVFLLFRAFDILKPWPLSRLERLPGGLGIMADDAMAGLVAGALVAAGAAFHIIK
jgi:phosphatidylglycerophosphatase A